MSWNSTAGIRIEGLVSSFNSGCRATFMASGNVVSGVVLDMINESGNKDKFGQFYNWNVRLNVQLINGQSVTPHIATLFVRCDHEK